MTVLSQTKDLLAEGLKEAGIATRLGITRHAARKLVAEAEQYNGRTLIAHTGAALPALSFYDTARNALAQAKTLAEVKNIGDKAAAMQEYARRLNDFTLEMDAAEIRIAAKLALGDGLIAIKQGTGFAKGGQPYQAKGKKSTAAAVEAVAAVLPTLREIGVTDKQSAEAQKLAKAVPAKEREARLDQWRKTVESTHRVTIDILKPGPGRSMNRTEPQESRDDFWTPPWATRALMDIVFPQLGYFGGGGSWTAWEPACGEGHMAEVLREYFKDVYATDVHDYGYGTPDVDFLEDTRKCEPADWIITNPPFKNAHVEKFILRALELAQVGVAMFCSLQTLEGISRYESIFSKSPPTLIAFWVERVNCCKGKWDPDGSTDAAYVWLVWVKDRPPMMPFWIPPGQKSRLTRDDDRARFAAWSIKDAAE